MEQLFEQHGNYLLHWAAKNGRLDVLKWGFEQGRCSAVKLLFLWASAASHGHLNILKWAHENGYTWDEWVYISAAEHGHLHVIKWVYELGYPWDKHTCSFAMINNHFNTVQWVVQKKLPAKSEVHRWFRLINDSCNEITYNDLSELIKKFI
jgi:hypothetical protein